LSGGLYSATAFAELAYRLGKMQLFSFNIIVGDTKTMPLSN
jgi:hypothetical protein